MFKAKKIVVTGGAGFIGSTFLRYLLKNQENIEITHVDALTYAGNLVSLADIMNHPRHQFVKADIRNAEEMFRIIGDADLIVNFAAESHVDRSIDGPREFIETNINGTFHLLEAARKIHSQGKEVRYVQVSTDEVYGSLDHQGQFTEQSPLAPNSPYSASKAAADLLVRSYFHTFGLNTVITRCSNNYGPYQFPEKLIPLMISKARQNQPLPVYGDGLNVRDWIHVEDHARGVWQAAILGRAGEVYNFGSDNEWTNLAIVRKILALLGRPESLIQFVKDRPGHDRRYAIDASKAKRELNWRPEIDFATGLSRTIDWYVDNEKWLQSVQSGEYRSFFARWYEERK